VPACNQDKSATQEGPRASQGVHRRSSTPTRAANKTPLLPPARVAHDPRLDQGPEVGRKPYVPRKCEERRAPVSSLRGLSPRLGAWVQPRSERDAPRCPRCCAFSSTSTIREDQCAEMTITRPSLPSEHARGPPAGCSPRSKCEIAQQVEAARMLVVRRCGFAGALPRSRRPRRL